MAIDMAIGAAKKVKVEKAAEEGKPLRKNSAIVIQKDQELTDEEWLATSCGTVLNVLKHKIAYRNDALLYRHIVEPLIRFRKSARKAAEEAKSKSGHNGGFFPTFTASSWLSIPSTGTCAVAAREMGKPTMARPTASAASAGALPTKCL